MREVIGKRVGVRWTPPALVYVYQMGDVLRMARIPVRDLEDEDAVDRMYDKHKNGILQGLERRYVDRMLNILRHHHGIELPDKQTDKSTSEPAVSAAASEVISTETRSSSRKSNSDRKVSEIKENADKEKSAKQDFPRANKLIDIQPINNNKRTRNTDLLSLLNQASGSNEDNEVTVTVKESETNQNKSTLKQIINPKDQISKQANNQTKKEILELISDDLSKVQKEKMNLAEIVKKNISSNQGKPNGVLNELKGVNRNQDANFGKESGLLKNLTSNYKDDKVTGKKNNLFDRLNEDKIACDDLIDKLEKNYDTSNSLRKGNLALNLSNNHNRLSRRNISSEKDERKEGAEEDTPRELLNDLKETKQTSNILVDNEEDQVKITLDDHSEDTDLDLDDVDIPLDPDEPNKPASDILDDDDFWS